MHFRFPHVRRSSASSPRRDRPVSEILIGVPHTRESMDFFRRPGSSGRRSMEKMIGTGKPSAGPDHAVRMELAVESPPLVCYGLPAQSSGALFSGQLQVHVLELSVLFEKFSMQLLCTTTYKKPVAAQCRDCARHVEELHSWEFLKEPTKYKHGVHSFPVSHLLPGKSPATTHGCNVRIDYHLRATATTSMGEVITFEHPLTVQRAIQPGSEKLSVRLFPPTNMAMNVTLPPVIHPIGEFNVQMQLTGITAVQNGYQHRWRIRKLTWRIEEQEKTLVPACPKHICKTPADLKGTPYDNTRVLAERDVKTNLKHDFPGDQAMSEFPASIKLSANPACDVSGPHGLAITHAFVVEMIVAEEYAPVSVPASVTPTGNARVLRASFNVHLTERAGLGVSWDEEQPPLYQDVPASPPHYAQMLDYDGPDLEMEQLHIS